MMDTPGNEENFISPAPRPTPKFYNTQESPLSTKKKRNKTRMRTFMMQHSNREEKLKYLNRIRDELNVPRTAPVWEGRFVNRRFQAAHQRAHFITFRSRSDHFLDRVQNRHYDEARNESYFDQCFEIERKIGQGSFGEVFRVESKEDGRWYAVKRAMEPFRGTSDRLLKLSEVQKHELLPKHVNLVNFVGAWEERGRLYIQTELCDYSLSDYADKEHEIPETILWRYFVDLLRAVKHLHDHDLLHLDIKPENIFISGDICKLGDFGLIFDLKSGDIATVQEGDSKYLAPEMLEGQISKAADVFSLGMSMLELACDLDVPSGDKGWHMLRQGDLPCDMMKDLSWDFRRLLRMMLDPEPGRRPSAEQLLNDPAVRSHLRNRQIYLYYHQMLSVIKRSVSSVWMLIGWILLLIMSPIIKWFSRHVSNASKKREGGRATPSHFRTPPTARSSVIREDSTELNQTPQRRLDLDFAFSDDEEIRSTPKFQVSPYRSSLEQRERTEVKEVQDHPSAETG